MNPSEMLLFADLHLYDELSDFLGSALDVEHRIAVFQRVARVLDIYEFKFFDFQPEDMFQKPLSEMFVLLLAQQLLEGHVDHRVDILCVFDCLFHNS